MTTVAPWMLRGALVVVAVLFAAVVGLAVAMIKKFDGARTASVLIAGGTAFGGTVPLALWLLSSAGLL